MYSRGVAHTVGPVDLFGTQVVDDGGDASSGVVDGVVADFGADDRVDQIAHRVGERCVEVPPPRDLGLRYVLEGELHATPHLVVFATSGGHEN